jgi:hypothetical protein
MLAAAQSFQGLPAGQVAPYLVLHRGETAFWLLPGVALVETAAQLALPPPTYADFRPYPAPPGPPFAGHTIDIGVAIVTNKRIVLVGAHRREWLYTKLEGLAHLPDHRTTIMRVTNRIKVSGLAMDPAAAPSFRFNVALGLAEFANDRAGLVQHLQQQIAHHQTRRPQPPVAAKPHEAPLAARLGRRPIVSSAVIALVVLCGLVSLIGLLTPTPTASPGPSPKDTTAATTIAQPPASPVQVTTTPAAPTSSPAATPPPPRRTSPPPTRSAPRTVKPAPRRTSSPAKRRTMSLCGAPSNPYGYNYCGRGVRIYDPKPDICLYFDCIPAFGDGVGYMIECQDGMVSMSGGRRGSCSHHGGNRRPVYDG